MLDWVQTLLSQYSNSPTLVQLVKNMNGYLDPSTNINAFYSLVWNVETAVGYGLEVWGRIVGVGRVLQIESVLYFGFQGPAGASGTGFNQGIFYNGETVTSNYTLLDDPFRALILAKALANISNATIPAINQILINLFGPDGPLPVAGNSFCTDGLNMTMTYTFGSPLTPIQLAIVQQSGVLPRPCGVGLTIVQVSGLYSDGGVLALTDPSAWPSTNSAGNFYSDGGVCAAVPGGPAYNPASLPVFFGLIGAEALLELTTEDIPPYDPGVFGQIYLASLQLQISAG